MKNLANLDETNNSIFEKDDIYQMLVQNSPNIIIIIQNNVVKYINKSASKLLKWPLKEIQEPSFDFVKKIFPERFQSLVIKNMMKRQQGIHIAPYNIYLKNHYNEEIPVRVIAQNITYLGKPATEYTIIDISRQKEEEELQKNHNEVMLKMLTHDIRNPLQNISFAAYILQNDSSDRKKEMVDLIKKNVKQIDVLLNELSQFFGESNLVLEDADIIKLMNKAIKRMVIPRNIKIKYDKPKIPIIKVDKVKIGQVFTNIILNSFQAMTKGGELSIIVKALEDMVEVVIKDSGVGVSEKNLEKMFTPFYTTKARGTGLGLANSKNIVEAHKGKITIDSQKGKGTIITIKLPLK